MFFDDQKIVAMREMILSDSVEGRDKALAKLLPYQKADFYGILKAMDGCHVTSVCLTHLSTSSYHTIRQVRRLWLTRWA
jgi:hypothetical protein